MFKLKLDKPLRSISRLGTVLLQHVVTLRHLWRAPTQLQREQLEMGFDFAVDAETPPNGIQLSIYGHRLH